MDVKLGTIVTDRITGLTGMAVARIEYLNGCISVCVQPKELKDGKPVRTSWIDEQQLTEESEAKSGGPGPTPPPMPTPD